MKIGVIGAGVMGRGVAQVFAEGGYDVVLLDIKKQALEEAENDIRNTLRFRSLFEKSDTLEDSDSVLGRIHFTDDYNTLSSVNDVIENATEEEATKDEIYKKLDKICNGSCLFIVNTSCISITKIASKTNRADKVIGVHFMNPVPLKKTVEVIKGFYTSSQTLEAIRVLLNDVGKEIIVVNDYPGFVSNRISHLFMNEAAFVVQDGVAAARDVDDIFKKCYGHVMGPLETADLIGLDTVVNSLKVLYDNYQDPKFRCCPLLAKMVQAGQLGRKSGRGFYVYK